MCEAYTLLVWTDLLCRLEDRCLGRLIVGHLSDLARWKVADQLLSVLKSKRSWKTRKNKKRPRQRPREGGGWSRSSNPPPPGKRIEVLESAICLQTWDKTFLGERKRLFVPQQYLWLRITFWFMVFFFPYYVEVLMANYLIKIVIFGILSLKSTNILS